MFPLSINNYIIGGLLIISTLLFAYGRHEHNLYVSYKAEVEALGKAQEIENASKDKQAALITQGVKNEYEAKLSNIRNFYGSGLHVNPNSSKTTGISPTPTGTDASAAYSVLVGQCAETAQQLVSIQEWLNEQIDIK